VLNSSTASSGRLPREQRAGLRAAGGAFAPQEENVLFLPSEARSDDRVGAGLRANGAPTAA